MVTKTNAAAALIPPLQCKFSKDDYLLALKDIDSYSKRSDVLEEYSEVVAKTGKTMFQWDVLKPYFLWKLAEVMKLMTETAPYEPLSQQNAETIKPDQFLDKIISAALKLDGIPFTLQRIFELLVNPKKHYKRSDKFLRALEKNILVVTTQDPEGWSGGHRPESDTAKEMSMDENFVENEENFENGVHHVEMQNMIGENGIDQDGCVRREVMDDLNSSGDAALSQSRSVALASVNSLSPERLSGGPMPSIVEMWGQRSLDATSIVSVTTCNINNESGAGIETENSSSVNAVAANSNLVQISISNLISPLFPAELSTNSASQIEATSPPMDQSPLSAAAMWLGSKTTAAGSSPSSMNRNAAGELVTSVDDSVSNNMSTSLHFATMTPLKVPSTLVDDVVNVGQHTTPLPPLETAFSSCSSVAYVDSSDSMQEISAVSLFCGSETVASRCDERAQIEVHAATFSAPNHQRTALLESPIVYLSESDVLSTDKGSDKAEAVSEPEAPVLADNNMVQSELTSEPGGEAAAAEDAPDEEIVATPTDSEEPPSKRSRWDMPPVT